MGSRSNPQQRLLTHFEAMLQNKLHIFVAHMLLYFKCHEGHNLRFSEQTNYKDKVPVVQD